MKLASWNVNGIRACFAKNFRQWLEENPKEIVCLQEVKATNDVVEELFANHPDYHLYNASAEKKGYSGVLVLSHKGIQAPLSVQVGLCCHEYDREGRTLILEYNDFYLVNTYVPNGQRDHSRVDFKLRYSRDLLTCLNQLRDTRGKEIIVCGDFNTAHREIDLKNPKSNVNTSGFLPRERAFLDEFISHGYIDIFRSLHPTAEGQYTWWSYRPGCREKNIGWRIDYFFTTTGLLNKVKGAKICSSVLGSDHCPIELDLL